MSTTLTNLVNNMNTCSTNVGFKAFKFGKLSSINFDHNIQYDMLNFEFPQSSVDLDNNLETYNCIISAYHPTSKRNITGVEITDNVHVIMSALKKRLLNFLGCLGSSNCQFVISEDGINFITEKGTHNDNLLVVSCQFSIEVFVDCVKIDCGDYPPTPIVESYDCINGECVDPADGSGAYASLAACEATGCND